MRFKCFTEREEAAAWVGERIVKKIQQFVPQPQKPRWVLGLPTGSTPIPLYDGWVKAHRAGHLSFAQVSTFNMDEYVGIPPTSEKSYAFFMHHHLFDAVDLLPESIHLLDGMNPNDIEVCQAYDQAIQDAGGIDLQLAGVGRSGHLAFNEPFSSFGSRVRRVNLMPSTREANAKCFEGKMDQVPHQALTIGLKNILEARSLCVMAFGGDKAEALAKGIEGPMHHAHPLSLIQAHPDAWVIADKAAAAKLHPSTLQIFEAQAQEVGCDF